MNVTLSGGTDQQRQWVEDALHACSYPFKGLEDVTIEVSFVGLTLCTIQHTYMCTVAFADSSDYKIQIEDWADNPNDPNNAGLADPQADIREFFIDSFIHELGHVVQNERIVKEPAQPLSEICAFFQHVGDGRRGTVADYASGTVWPELIKEAISEYFRLAFHPVQQVYGNRTSWHLSESDYDACFRILMPPQAWWYDKPIELKCYVERREPGDDPVVVTEGSGKFYPNFELAFVSQYFPFLFGTDLYAEPYATDFVAGSSGSADFVSQKYQPGFGIGGDQEILLGVTGNDQYFPELPASDANFETAVIGGPWDQQRWQIFAIYDFPFNLSPPGSLKLLQDPGEPWATAAHADAPALAADLEARSGWLGVRAAILGWELPPHDWGVLEIDWNGRYLEWQRLGTENPPKGDSWNVYSDAVIPLSSYGPWAPNEIRGNGPLPNGPLSPIPANGYRRGDTVTQDREVNLGPVGGHSPSLGTGGVGYYISTTNVVQYLPGNAPGPLPANATPIVAKGDHISLIMQPDRGQQKTEFALVWTGATAGADTTEGVGSGSDFYIRARFFPVKDISQQAPPPYPQPPGSVDPGVVSGGVVRSKAP